MEHLKQCMEHLKQRIEHLKQRIEHLKQRMEHYIDNTTSSSVSTYYELKIQFDNVYLFSKL